MRKKGNCFVLVATILISAILSNFALAEDFDFALNALSYQEGNTIGESLIVKQIEQTGTKYFTGHQGIGKVRVSPISLSNEFEVFITVYIANSSTDLNFFLISGDSDIKVSLGKYNFNVELNDSGPNSESWRQGDANEIKLHVNGSIAKLYVNDVFFDKVTLDEPNLTFTNLVMIGLRENDALYELKGRNLQPGTSPPTPTYTWGLSGNFDFDLNVSSHQEGDTIGKSLIVAQNYISGHQGIGKVRVSPISLSDEFEVFIRIYITNSSTDLNFFLISGDSAIKISFGKYNFNVELNDSGPNSKSWQSMANDIRLYVNGNIAKLYINDVFFKKITLDEPNLTYTTLVMTGIRENDALYELKGRNLQSGTSPPTPTYTWGLSGNFDFDLNLSSYQEGDTSIGENLILMQVEQTGLKYITGYQGIGKLDISPISLSNEFEVFIRIYITNSSTDLNFFLISDEFEIKLSFGKYNFNVELNDSGPNSKSWQSMANDIRLYVNGNIAKLYINDVFFNKVTLDESNLTYTKLTMSGLKENDKLYELKGRNGTSGPTPTEVIWDADGNKKWSLPDIIYGLQVLTDFRTRK